MSYSVNGKVYTDHPLMDEMVYNLDQIMDNIVLKNEVRALSEETAESLNSAAIYMAILNDRSRFESFPFTKEMLSAYGYNSLQVVNYYGDRYRIPKEEREDFLAFCEEYYVDHYEEANNYYRKLMGLPEYNTGETYFVYLDSSYFTDPEFLDQIDLSVPVHLYDQYQISLLDMDGGLTKMLNNYRGEHYGYLHFLGDRSIDLYKARQASKWDILYMPSVDHLVDTRFKQIFLINKENYLQRVYSEAYKLYSDAYEECMMVMLICQTYADMIADIPEWYIRRDIFDIRSCQYFLESQGVKFFKQIPLKYQINIVRNLNKLIRYKSTNQNIWDILDLFGVENTEVFKYYLLKKRVMNSDGSYTVDEEGKPAFELEFVKTPIGDTYDNTIKDNIYRTPYDDITYSDKYWDGEDIHSLVKDGHMEEEFTIEGTKYMSLDLYASMKEYQFQMVYFLGLLMDSTLDTGDIKVNLPLISPRVSFRLSDLFILLYCLTGSFEDYGNKIFIPTEPPADPKPEFSVYNEIDGGGPDIEADDDLFGGWSDTMDKFRRPANGGGPELEYTELNSDSYYEWMRGKYSYLWADLTNRVKGFNMNADMAELADLISMRHSSFGFDHGYTLEDLGVEIFTPAASITSITELIRVYKINKEAHDNLYEKMTQAETRDDMVIYRFVYDYLFTKEFDIEHYTLFDGTVAEDYEQILKQRNIILWKYYNKVISEPDLETKQDMIRQAMNDIVNTLSYYLNDEALNYIFAFTSVASLDSLLNYIYLMIDFFKSFKVHFLEPHVTYILDDKLENTGFAHDMLTEIKEAYWKQNHHYINDSAQITEIIQPEDHPNEENVKEILDVAEQYEPIPGFDMNIDGMHITDPDENDRIFDGGRVDLLSYSPYIMLNGGRIASGWDIWDMNGGSAHEMKYYLEADGKYPDNELGYQGAQTIGYSVDGGHPDLHMYMRRSMTVRVTDNQILASVNLFKSKRNLLETDSTGLLLSRDQYVNPEELYEIRSDLEGVIDYYSKVFNECLDEIEFAKDPTNVDSVIRGAVDRYFITARQVITEIEEGEALKEMNEYTDKRVKELHDLFDNFNILGWGSF